MCLPSYSVLPVQVVDYLIDPFVAGTSAGDPDSLSVSTVLFFLLKMSMVLNFYIGS